MHRRQSVCERMERHRRDYHEHGILKQHDGPLEAHHELQSGDCKHRDQDIPCRARGEYRPGPLDERRSEKVERIDAGRNREGGRAEGVIEENHPARQEPQVRIEYPGDPGVGGARALIPAVQTLIRERDAEHGDQADQNGDGPAVAADGHQPRQADRESLRGPRARKAHDDRIPQPYPLSRLHGCRHSDRRRGLRIP